MGNQLGCRWTSQRCIAQCKTLIIDFFTCYFESKSDVGFKKHQVYAFLCIVALNLFFNEIYCYKKNWTYSINKTEQYYYGVMWLYRCKAYCLVDLLFIQLFSIPIKNISFISKTPLLPLKDYSTLSREVSLSCQRCCDIVLSFFWSHPSKRPTKSPCRTSKAGTDAVELFTYIFIIVMLSPTLQKAAYINSLDIELCP